MKHLPRGIQSLSHLDRTNYYEKVVLSAGGSPFLASYGELIAVTAGSPGTINAPSMAGLGTEATTKDAFHFGVVSVDGTGFTLSGNGKNINGSSSITIAATPGASAYLYYSNVLGEWIAFLSGGATAAPLPSATGKNGSAVPLNNSTPTTVLESSPLTAAVGQKFVVTFSCEIDNAGETAPLAEARLYIDTIGGEIDTFKATTIASGSITMSWTLEELGDGSAHIFGLGIQLSTAESVTVPVDGCRYVVQVVGG
jgi:hypothetical protein